MTLVPPLEELWVAWSVVPVPPDIVEVLADVVRIVDRGGAVLSGVDWVVVLSGAGWEVLAGTDFMRSSCPAMFIICPARNHSTRQVSCSLLVVTSVDTRVTLIKRIINHQRWVCIRHVYL